MVTSITKRKDQHINLARKAQVETCFHDNRFFYEPLAENQVIPLDFKICNKSLNHPLWISSMTGGGTKSQIINQRLAYAAKKFGLGISSGSCRVLFESDKSISDFDLRPILGDSVPYFLNIGYSQAVEQNFDKINRLISQLSADGVVIHINPIQEYLQKDSKITEIPIDQIIEKAQIGINYPIIIKEVGQGFGPESLKKLMRFKLEAIELSAFGGTNFSQIEIFRTKSTNLSPLAQVGNTLDQMIESINQISQLNEPDSNKFILSGGVKNFLDAHYFLSKINQPAIYGQASTILDWALVSEKCLYKNLEEQFQGLNFVRRFLSVK